MNNLTRADGPRVFASKGLRRASTPIFAVTLIAACVTVFTQQASVHAAGSDNLATSPKSPTLPASFADLVSATRPSVVAIMTRSNNSAARPGSSVTPGLPPGHPLRRFFERQPQRAVQGVGSGFIVDAGGYIVTNNHVIRDADEITVVLHDGTELTAKVHGRDARTDLALLKVSTDKALHAARFGDSDAARVGDWVVAVGSPFGLGGTYTAGIISARGRDINAGPYDDFLQIDASINRGNSGGALFNTAGQVVGVNTAIFSPNGGNVGIGFAVPAALAKRVIDDLMDDGLVQRGWLGVQIQPVTKELAEALNLSSDAGALVADVTPSSPAAKAGLRAGDVILKVGSDEVAQVRDLSRLIAASVAGESVKLSLWRDGRAQDAKVTIGALPAAQVAAADSEDLGLAIAPLDQATRTRFGVPAGINGVVVTDVRRGSAAAELGLRAGVVIEMVAQKRVSVPADVVASIAAARARNQDSVLLLVTSPRGGRQFMALSLSLG
jgi:serine protease Do